MLLGIFNASHTEFTTLWTGSCFLLPLSPWDLTSYDSLLSRLTQNSEASSRMLPYPRVFCCTCSSFPQKLFPADAPVSGRPSRTSHQKGTPPAAIYHRPLTPSVAIRDQSILETDEVTGFLPNGPTEMDLRSAASKRVTFFRTATVCGREQATEQLL